MTAHSHSRRHTTEHARITLLAYGLIGFIWGAFVAAWLAASTPGWFGWIALGVAVGIATGLIELAYDARIRRHARPVVRVEHQHCHVVPSETWDDYFDVPKGGAA